MEEAKMLEEEMIAKAPSATTFTINIPNFLQEYSLSKPYPLRNRRTSLCKGLVDFQPHPQNSLLVYYLFRDQD
jgi:hypothetical protein